MESISIKRKKWSLGLFMLSIVVFSWVLSSFLINEIFEKNLYRKPFFITYLNTITFIFYLVPYIRKVFKNYKETGSLKYKEIINEFENEFDSSDEEIALNGLNNKLSLNETIKLSAQFCVLWYLANLSTNSSLSYTSVGLQTILSSTSSFFTLLIGSLVKTEKFNKNKIIGILFSFIGVILITKFNSKNIEDYSKNSNLNLFIGNSLALFGAFLYGFYTTLLKFKIKNELRINMKIFFGFIGIFTLIFLWPLLILFNYIGIEKFELPSNTFIIGIIILNCLITFISDFCWVKAILLTSPLTVTVGLSTTIPFSIFGDLILKQEKFSIIYIFAAVMIGISFFIINKDGENDKNS